MKQLKVILSEDHAVYRRTLKLLLERESDIIVVGEAASGPEACDLVDRLKPDFLLTDVRLPRMDGVHLAKWVTSKHPQTKVIVLTLLADDVTRGAAADAGAYACLSKESRLQGLLDVLRGACEQASCTPGCLGPTADCPVAQTESA